jgi:hypothetical protein
MTSFQEELPVGSTKYSISPYLVGLVLSIDELAHTNTVIFVCCYYFCFQCKEKTLPKASLKAKAAPYPLPRTLLLLGETSVK